MRRSQEVLGIEVQTFVTNSLYEMEEAASDTCAAVNLEVWYTEEDVTDYYVKKLGLAVESFIGYVGRDGLYTQNYVFGFGGQGTAQDLASSHGNFLPDGTFGVDELNQSFPGGAPDYGCNKTKAQWNLSECVQGRWCVVLEHRSSSICAARAGIIVFRSRAMDGPCISARLPQGPFSAAF